MILFVLMATSQREAGATGTLCPAILPEQHGEELSWGGPPLLKARIWSLYMEGSILWGATDSKPGTTHVAKHLHPILAEDQRIHTAEEIFEHSEYGGIPFIT